MHQTRFKWYYAGCVTCNKKVHFYDDKLWCHKCDKIPKSTIPRYYYISLQSISTISLYLQFSFKIIPILKNVIILNRYQLHVEVYDPTSKASFVIFDKEACHYIGQTAQQLHECLSRVSHKISSI